MSSTSRISALAAVVAVSIAAGPVSGFANPQQSWASPDGNVHLLRPIVAIPTRSDAAFGSLMTAGWRLDWDGSTATPGALVVRLALRVVPAAPQTTAREVLQVGVSRDPGTVRSCTIAGLKGSSGRHLPDRIINGRRFTVWTNGDAGMSQAITATDLRTVVGGACYAVERFTYGDSASDRNPAITLSQASGAHQLDLALASLQLGHVSAASVVRPPAVPSLGHSVAR